MSQRSNKLDFLHEVLGQAAKAGASAADAAVTESASTSAKCRDGNLEKAERAESSSISLRVFVGNRIATISSTDLDKRNVTAMVERAVATAKRSPKDESAGLVAAGDVAKDLPDNLERYDTTSVGIESLLDTALEIEAAALSTPGVSSSAGAAASASIQAFALCTSNGFSGESASTGFGRYCGAMAEDSSGKQVDYATSNSLFLSDLEDAKTVGSKAGDRAVGRLGGRKAPSGKFPVVYSRRVSSTLIQVFSSLISGPSVVTGMTCLRESLEKQVFGKHIQIVDDPLRKRGLASRAFDGEGVATQRSELIRDGRLTSWLLNYDSARRLGLSLTGHGGMLGDGVNPSNLDLLPSSESPAGLMSDIKFGFYVTHLMGHGPNDITGDYSIGASGYAIENGEITYPVKGMTIAGNVLEMFLNMMPADDLELRHSSNAPTLRVDGLTVSGT